MLRDKIQVEIGESCSLSWYVDMTVIVELDSLGLISRVFSPSDGFNSKVFLDRETNSCSASGDTLLL